MLDSPAAQGKTAARSKRGQASDEGGEEGEEVEEAAVQRAGTSKAAAGKGKAKGKGAGAAAAAAAAFSSRGAGGAGRKRGAAAQEEEEEDEDDGAGVYQPRKKKKVRPGWGGCFAQCADGPNSRYTLQASLTPGFAADAGGDGAGASWQSAGCHRCRGHICLPAAGLTKPGCKGQGEKSQGGGG